MECGPGLHLMYIKPNDQEMKLQGKFVIAEPCHEDWNKMTPETQGRFCASCQKCVVDFTHMNAQQMKKVYDEQQGNVCGRVKASQIAKPALRGKLPRISQKLKAFAFALLLAFGFAAAPKQAQAQKGEVMGKIAFVDQRSTISGTVRWDEGYAAVNIPVTLSQKDRIIQSTITDESGNFVLPYLEDGNYEITAGDRSYSYDKQKVKLGSRETVVLNFILTNVRLLGDTVYVDDPLEPTEIILTCPGVPDEYPPVDEFMIQGEMAWVPDDIKVVDPETPENTDQLPEPATVDLLVFPNPTSEEVTVEVNLPEGEPQVHAYLFDMNGKMLWEGPMQSRLSLQMAHHPAGTYILKVVGEAWVQEKRIVKQ